MGHAKHFLASLDLRRRAAHWIKKHRFLSEINGLEAGERGRILQDLNLSDADLPAFADGPLSREQLSRVLALLGLNEKELETDEPLLMSALRENCAKCPDWIECERDLDRRRFSHDVEDYCVNKDTLRSLTAERE